MENDQGSIDVLECALGQLLDVRGEGNVVLLGGVGLSGVREPLEEADQGATGGPAGEGPGGYDARGRDRGNPAALRVGKVHHLAALRRVVKTTGQCDVIDRQLGYMISMGSPGWMTKRDSRPATDGRRPVTPASSHSESTAQPAVRWGPFGDHTPCAVLNNTQVATCYARPIECL
jgi:hypothetical protein